MDINTIANAASVPVGLVCLALAIRAFYLYVLSRSDVVFVIGFAMASIALAILFGVTGEVHLGGNSLQTDWARYTGSSSGALFIFLSSLVKSHEQMKQLRRWQLVVAMVFLSVILLTPILPPLSPLVSAAFSSVRTVIYGAAFIRYASLYAFKGTRFSLIMCVGFLLLAIGFGLFTPHLLFPNGYAT
ncbi:MAG TPA: hypothetical protein VH593_15765, partial [Ktedonobacteraceae bacterium]